MRTLLFAVGCVMLASAPALACRGTAEYPQVAAQLAKLDLPAAQKAAYAKKLEEGKALHQKGHELDNQELRKESLKILDELKAELAK